MGEIQSLARGLKILEDLADRPQGAGITELAELYGIDKGSMSRLLQTMTNYGFAEKDPATRKYLLGPQVVRLSRALLARMPLRDTAKPFLLQMVEKTGECAHLAILSQDQALYIDQAESPNALRVTTGVGTMAPLHCTALGKILLSYCGCEMPKTLQAFTVRTITNPLILETHLHLVRSQGYAVDDEEYNHGVRCLAVPVFDFREKCVAAIGVSGPTSRLTLEVLPSIASTVVEVGKALSARLSFKSERSGD